MNLTARIAGGATALAMVGVFGLTAAIPAGAAPATAQTTTVVAAPGLPVTGTLADGTPFVGQLTNLTTSVVNALMLSGTIAGTGITAGGAPFSLGAVSGLLNQILPGLGSGPVAPAV